MNDEPIRVVAIVGGGTAGWMTAAVLAKSFGPSLEVQVIEPGEIGSVRAPEATVPYLAAFNHQLELPEQEFVRRTDSTFRLGVEFRDWARIGDTYFHGFGAIGHEMGMLPFHQYWLKARRHGLAKDISAYALNVAAAREGRFTVAPRDAPANSPLRGIPYGYHFDANAYAAYLRQFATQRGVKRIEGSVREAVLDGTTGFVAAVRLHDARLVPADFFIDCSGPRAVLLNEALHVGFEDWSHWLPCDQAVSVVSQKGVPAVPYTQALARAAGWQWRIPLQHCTGHGYAYCSRYLSMDEATAVLLRSIDGEPLHDPTPVPYGAGRRERVWEQNVVAIGGAGGFGERLESNEMFLVQSGILRLLQLFPRRDFSPVLREAYNTQTRLEYERMRDFLILHYHATTRDDSPLWRQCRDMSIPDSLRATIELFADSGRLQQHVAEVFGVTSWVQVMLGQHIEPRSYSPAVDWVSNADLRTYVDGVEKVISSCIGMMPMHEDFIARNCAAP